MAVSPLFSAQESVLWGFHSLLIASLQHYHSLYTLSSQARAKFLGVTHKTVNIVGLERFLCQVPQ
jgi:hypothetical protein